MNVRDDMMVTSSSGWLSPMLTDKSSDASESGHKQIPDTDSHSLPQSRPISEWAVDTHFPSSFLQPGPAPESVDVFQMVNADMASYEKELKKYEQELKKHEQELKKHEQALQTRTSELDQMRMERDQLAKELEASRQRSELINGEKSLLNKELQGVKKQLKHNKDEKDRVQKKLLDLAPALEQAKPMAKAIIEQRDKIKELEDKLKQQRQALSEEQAKRSQLEKNQQQKIAALEKSLSKQYSEREQELLETIKGLESTNTCLGKKLVEAGRKQGLNTRDKGSKRKLPQTEVPIPEKRSRPEGLRQGLKKRVLD